MTKGEGMTPEEYIAMVEEENKELFNKRMGVCDRFYELEEENKKLKDKIKRLEFDVDAWHQLKLLLEGEIERLKINFIMLVIAIILLS